MEIFHTYSVYPEEVYIYLMVGIDLVIIVFLMTQFKGEATTEHEKDNRAFINKVWENKVKVGYKAVAITLIALVVAIFNLNRALSLIVPILFLGVIKTGLLYIIQQVDFFVFAKQNRV